MGGVPTGVALRCSLCFAASCNTKKNVKHSPISSCNLLYNLSYQIDSPLPAYYFIADHITKRYPERFVFSYL